MKKIRVAVNGYGVIGVELLHAVQDVYLAKETDLA